MLVLVFIPATALSLAEDSSEREKAIKAGYIYNFAKFVSWPSATKAAGRIIFCVGEDPAFTIIFRNIVAGKKIGNLPVDVVDMFAGDSPIPCHVLYIPHTKPDLVEQLLDDYPGKPVLSVGDASDFIGKGGIISFFVDGGRLRFEIGLSNAGKSGLVLSSELLELARIRQ
ncbi:MAG: YfiR family protein [Nitrospinota bacterium]|nr:YfiR family protein [Nitrospinota bacterium]